MTSSRQRARPRRSNRPAAIEWVGGIVSMPAYVTGEGEPYQPETLLWLSGDGAIVGTATAKPGELSGMASESLRSAIARPVAGRPHAPARVRVASPALARALRSGHPEIEVVCAPTPELDEVAAAMVEMFAGDPGSERSYLSPDVGPDAVAALFRAAAGLYRAAPWKIVPSDENLFSVSIGELGIEEAALSVIGQNGQSFGLLLFPGLDDFERYLDAAEFLDYDDEPDIPRHLALDFDRAKDVGERQRREVAEHGWEVAAPDAYPYLRGVDEGLVARPPAPKEVTAVEAIALALPELLSDADALSAAWDGGEPVSRTISIRTSAGEMEVTLRAPYERDNRLERPSGDVLARLSALAQDGDIDPDARRLLEEEILVRFDESPEATGLSAEERWCGLVLDLAADYLGATIATVEADDLREILFEIIPRKVSVEASAARAIIEEMRAFYTFLKREFGLGQADACLRVLGGRAAERLEAAMSDPRNFGMAKSMVMGGQDAGFDIASQDGLDAWMQAVNSGMFPPPSRCASAAPAPQADRAAARAKQKKKNKRKTARKARKRNR